MRSSSRSRPGTDRAAPLKCGGGVLLLTYPEKAANAILAKGNLSFRGDQDTLVVQVARRKGGPCYLKTTRRTAE